MGTHLNPLTDAVLTVTHNVCFEPKYENYQNFSSESFRFCVVKYSIYLNRCVFVMCKQHIGPCLQHMETRRSLFIPRRGRQYSFVEIDREIFSTVILSLPLIQEGQLSVSGERMCTILVNCLED